MKFPRMSGWLFFSIFLLALVSIFAPQQLTVVLYKIALVPIAAVMGYWVDRSLFKQSRPDRYLDDDTKELIASATMLRRAVIVLGVMLVIGLGL